MSARFGAISTVYGVSVGWGGDIHIQRLDLMWPQDVGLEVHLIGLTTQVHVGAILQGIQRLGPIVIEKCDVVVHDIPDDPKDYPDEIKRRLTAVQRDQAAARSVAERPSTSTTPVLEVGVRSGSVTTGGPVFQKLADSLLVSLKRGDDGEWSVEGTLARDSGASKIHLVGGSRKDPWLEVRGSRPWTILDGTLSFGGVRIEKSGLVTIFDVSVTRAISSWGVGRGTAEEVTAQFDSIADRRPTLRALTILRGHFDVVAELEWFDLVRRVRGHSSRLSDLQVDALNAMRHTDFIEQFPVQISPNFVISVKDSRLTVSDPTQKSAVWTVQHGVGRRDAGKLVVDAQAAVRVGTFPAFSSDFNMEWDIKRGLMTKIAADIDDISLSSLMRFLRFPEWTAVAGVGRLELNWTRPSSSVDFLPSHRDGGWQSTVSVRDWVVLHEKISPLPVVISGWRAAVTGSIPPVDSRGALKVSVTHSGGATAEVHVVVDRGFKPPRFDVLLHVPEQECASLLSAIPSGMLPTMASKLTVSGRFEGDLNLFEFDPAYFPRLRLESEGSLSACRIESLGPIHDERLRELQGKFKIEVDEGDGPIGVYVGPRTPGYMPFPDIPELVRSGAILSEDGEFFVHEGISLKLIEGALRLDLAKGRYVYGGSTITQQLVKNLFVGRTKSLSRKLEELFIVLKLEQTMRKERILELYLNCIEYGVNLYGIRNASHHYFGKDPRDLTGVEVAFLMHLKTTPKEAWYLAKQGMLPERWRNAVRTRMKKMVERGRITQEEFESSAPYDPIAARNGSAISQ